MHNCFFVVALLLTGLSLTANSAAQDANVDLSVTDHGRTAFMANERQRRGWYDGVYHFSPAVRGGDYIYLSGVVAGAYGATEPLDRDGFKASVVRAFNTIDEIVKAAGATMNQVVKMRTFHVFDSPLVTIGKAEQVQVVAEVKGDFISEPHPAWTAVGTTALLPDAGLVEIEIILYSPIAKQQ